MHYGRHSGKMGRSEEGCLVPEKPETEHRQKHAGSYSVPASGGTLWQETAHPDSRGESVNPTVLGTRSYDGGGYGLRYIL